MRTRFWSVCRGTRGHHRIKQLEVGDDGVVGVLLFKNERDGWMACEVREMLRAVLMRARSQHTPSLQLHGLWAPASFSFAAQIHLHSSRKLVSVATNTTCDRLEPSAKRRSCSGMGAALVPRGLATTDLEGRRRVCSGPSLANHDLPRTHAREVDSECWSLLGTSSTVLICSRVAVPIGALSRLHAILLARARLLHSLPR